MTEFQLEALLTYIDARIDEKISDALGRDGLHESIRRMEFEDELRTAIREAKP